MNQRIPYLFLLFGFMILFLNCKDLSVTPPEETIPEISGIELNVEQIIVNDSVLLTATLSEELGEEYVLKWNLKGYQAEIDSITSETVFSWKAPKVHGSYEHSVQIVSISGEPISDSYLFSTEIASVPVVPLEGNKLVFSMQPEGEDRNQIFTMNVDGSALTQLTFYEEGNVSDPSWSPDGKSIIYTRFSGGWTGDPGMYLMDENGSNVRPLKIWEGPTGIHGGRTPKWSSNGVKIVYTAYLGNQEIMVYDFETDEITRLTNHIASDSQPSWSSDSKQIVFASSRDYYDADTARTRSDLYLIDVDGQNLNRLTEYGYTLDPIWSRNGLNIAFRDIQIPNKLGLVDIESGQREIIPEPFPDEELTFLHPVAWSQDDMNLLIRLREHPNNTVHILDVIAGTSIKLPIDPQRGIDVDWYQYEE